MKEAVTAGMLQGDETVMVIRRYSPFREDDQAVYVLSYDEKPGIQATANTSAY